MEDPPAITLTLPRQDQSELQLFQADEAAVQEWVQALPVGDTNRVVQMLVEAFDDLNRTKLAPELRYKLMEALLSSLEVALTNLSKRFLNQPLIMPSEPRKMAKIANRLYTQALTGYTVVALEAIQQRESIKQMNPARLTCQAIQRALIFTGRKLLQILQLHRPMEERCWETLHQLYALAEFQGLTELPVPEPLFGGKDIKSTYMQGLMLHCCKPNQLRQSDLTALFRGLQQWGELVKLNRQETGTELFLLDLGSDRPPQYRALYRDQPTAGCRTLDTSALLEQLKTLKESLVAQDAAFDKESGLSISLLNHLIGALGSMSMRNFKRTASNSPLWICLGLGNTHHQVSWQQLLKQVQGERSGSPKPPPVENNPFMPSIGKGDLWDKANPMEHHEHFAGRDIDRTVDLDAATKARVMEDENPAMPRREQHPVFEVQLADTSANGYCLEWIDEVPGDVRVGDIVGVKEDKKQNDWSIAVIRWLSRLRDSKTLLGLELLSPRAIAYGASIHRKGGEKTPPLKVLLLPEIKIVGQPNTLITPRAGFKERQKVTLQNNFEVQTIQLLRQISSTGSFEQFEFRFIKELGDILSENKTGKTGGTFDSLWSNI